MFEHKQKENAQSVSVCKNVLSEVIVNLSFTLRVKGLLQ